MTNHHKAPSRTLGATTILAASIVLCAGGLLLASISSIPATRQPSVARDEPATPPVATMLPLMSLDPASLAAGGVTGQAANAVIAVVQSRITSDWPTLRTLLAQRDAARARAERPPTADANGNLPSVAALRQSAVAAQAAVTNWIENTRQAAIADVAPEQQAALNQIFANRNSALPIEFRVLSLDQGDVVKLRDALSQRKRATQLNEALPSDTAAIIAAHESTSVLAARTRVAQATAEAGQQVP